MRKWIVTTVHALILLALTICTLSVTAIAEVLPESLLLSDNQIIIDLAESKYDTLKATILPYSAEQDVDWSTSNSNVVRVSNGKLTAHKTGTATITARSEEKSSVLATCTVLVIDSDVPVSLQLSHTTITIDLAKSSKAALTAAAIPAAANQRVNWKTNSSSVAKISSSGVITARKVGTATITATSREDSSVAATCTVNVIDSRIPTSITIPGVGASLTMERYQTLQLVAITEPAAADSSVKWNSSKSSVVSVTSKGVLTAKKAGTALITCYSSKSSNVKTVFQVTVKQLPSPTSISFQESTSVMILGSKLTLTPVTQPAGTDVCDYFTWKSSSSGRASVTADGVVTAKKTGWVTITCTSKQNSRIKATRKILIVTESSPHYVIARNRDTEEIVNDQTLTIYPGDKIQLDALVMPAGKNPGITWKSSSTGRATVDQTGLVSVKKKGSVTITATSKVNNEVKATIKLNVVNAPAPDEILLHAPSDTLEVSETMQMTAAAFPLEGKLNRGIVWSSSSTSIARVSDDGLVTPRKVGTVTITAKSAASSKIKATFKLRIIDTKLPDSVTLDQSGTITIENGQRLALNAEVLPATATQTLKWSSSKSSVASVDQSGVVTGVKSGTVTITAASTYNSSKKDTVKVKVVSKAAPAALSLTSKKQAIMVGETMQLTVSAVPSDASILGVYTSSNPAIATVDSSGFVTAHKTGSTVVTLKSLKRSDVSASITVVVYDENTPGKITLSDSTLYVSMGKKGQIGASIYPATAPQTVNWSSSDTSVVSVSSSGVLTPNKVGSAVITGQTPNGLSAKCQIYVTSTYVATTIPARTTNIAGIPENLSKIDDIRQSAKNQIMQLAMLGKISSSESLTRQKIIDRAFEMQAFPWMTESTQPYWTSKYAYKAYLPGNVYYGLPYIQSGSNGSYDNREYNVARALSEGRYTNSGKGYYLLNRDKRLNGMYVGNDCSSFMGISQYGIDHPSAFIRTKYLVTSTYYQTVRNFSDMRPGDFLVLGKSHTVMFLYWVNDAKTKMMIIEQGGDGNTVICSIHDLEYYTSQGYIARRRVDFDN